MRRRSTVTELGTPRIRVSSVQSRAWTPWNQVFQVASDSWARTAAATFAHRSSAAGVPTVAAPQGCPQVCPHVWRSTGQGGRLGRDPSGRLAGKCRAPGSSRGAGVADHISAVDNATSDVPRELGPRSRCRRPAGGWPSVAPGVDCRCSRSARRLRRPLARACSSNVPRARPGAPSGCGPGVRGGHA